MWFYIILFCILTIYNVALSVIILKLIPLCLPVTPEDKSTTLVKQIRKMKDEFDILSEKAKEKKQTQIDKKIKELQEYDQQTRTGLRQQRDEVVRKILKEIEQVIEKYAKKNSYTMILNNRILLYGQKQHDLTDKILKILNSEYKK